MNIQEIVNTLQEKHVWAVAIQDASKLAPCPFCGGEARVTVSDPEYGVGGASVRCSRCHARGPKASIYTTVINSKGTCSTPVLPESLKRGIEAAMDAWNSKTVDRERMGNIWITMPEVTAV